MQVLSLVHGPHVRSELWGDVVRAEGHELVEWELASQGEPPDGFDAVLVFGGEMNVGEEAENPWLHLEYRLLRGWVDAGTPLLGVCLGAQTLAHAAGGAVQRAPQLLSGFYETELTDAGVADPVLGSLPRRFEALNANGYCFTVPPGAVQLADGPVPQALRVGERAWGVQFHPEVRHDQVLGWWRVEAARPVAELEAALAEKLAGWQELGRRLCRAFLAVAAG
jgi:GMP synthase-like glutamine amidotransferase